MAKPTKAVTTKPKNAVSVGDDMLKLMEQDADKGVSHAMDDNVVPLVYILQPLSPQVIKKDPKHVQGAEAGQIWFRGTKKTLDGEEGMLVQPVFFSKCVLEWRPERGGFVTRHMVESPSDIAGARQIPNPKDPKKAPKWVSEEGNDLVMTREHVVIIHDVFDKPTPFVIPMAGSQHSSSRNWMGLMNAKNVPGTDKTAPSYAYLYRMTIEPRSDGKNNWYGWEIVDGGEDGSPLLIEDIAIYREARKIHDNFAKGTMRADIGDHEGDSENNNEIA